MLKQCFCLFISAKSRISTLLCVEKMHAIRRLTMAVFEDSNITYREKCDTKPTKASVNIFSAQLSMRNVDLWVLENSLVCFTLN